MARDVFSDDEDMEADAMDVLDEEMERYVLLRLDLRVVWPPWRH